MAKFVLRRRVYATAMVLATSVFLFGLARAAGDPRFLYLYEYTTKEQWDGWGKL
ncbi:MAG: ABC transporter permease, partial [Chloroflexi bacterium]|nr:ABC transporter permease [Chloroflexota bacterium]